VRWARDAAPGQVSRCGSGDTLTPGRTTIQASTPPGADGFLARLERRPARRPRDPRRQHPAPQRPPRNGRDHRLIPGRLRAPASAALPRPNSRQPVVDMPGPRCCYATDPDARPGCQVTAVLCRGPVALCASCDALRSTHGKGQAAARCPQPSPSTCWTGSPRRKPGSAMPKPNSPPPSGPGRPASPGKPTGASLDITRQAAQQRFGQTT